MYLYQYLGHLKKIILHSTGLFVAFLIQSPPIFTNLTDEHKVAVNIEQWQMRLGQQRRHTALRCTGVAIILFHRLRSSDGTGRPVTTHLPLTPAFLHCYKSVLRVDRGTRV